MNTKLLLAGLTVLIVLGAAFYLLSPSFNDVDNIAPVVDDAKDDSTGVDADVDECQGIECNGLCCDPGEACSNGTCTTIGNDVCEPDAGENCATSTDCACSLNDSRESDCDTDPNSGDYGLCCAGGACCIPGSTC